MAGSIEPKPKQGSNVWLEHVIIGRDLAQSDPNEAEGAFGHQHSRVELTREPLKTQLLFANTCDAATAIREAGCLKSFFRCLHIKHGDTGGINVICTNVAICGRILQEFSSSMLAAQPSVNVIPRYLDTIKLSHHCIAHQFSSLYKTC